MNKPATSERSGSFFLAFAIYVFSFCYYLIYYNTGISLTDEGWFVNNALRIIEGQIPYRDFLYYPPGAIYIVALLFKLFGTSLLVERLFWASIVSGSVTLTYFLSRWLMPLPFYVVPPVLALLVPGPWHKSLLPFFYLLAGVYAWRYIKAKRTTRSLIMGMMSGVVVYFRYDISVFIAMAFFVTIVAANFLSVPRPKDKFKELLTEAAGLAAGFLIVILPALIFMLTPNGGRSALKYILYLTFKQQGQGMMTYSFPVLSVLLLRQNFWAFMEGLFFYIPPLVTGAVAVLLIYRWRIRALDKKDLLLLALTVMGMTAYNQTKIRTDWGHLLQSVQIIYILGPYLVWEFYRVLSSLKAPGWSKFLKIATVVFGGCFAVLFIYLFFEKDHLYTGTAGILKQREVRLNIPGAGVYVRRDEAGEIEDMIRYINSMTRPDESILVVPYAPMIYVLSDRRNPTYFDAIFPGTFENIEKQEDFIRSVAEKKIRLIVYQDAAFSDNENGRFLNYARPLYEYIIQNYAPSQKFGQYQVYIKKKP